MSESSPKTPARNDILTFVAILILIVSGVVSRTWMVTERIANTSPDRIEAAIVGTDGTPYNVQITRKTTEDDRSMWARMKNLLSDAPR